MSDIRNLVLRCILVISPLTMVCPPHSLNANPFTPAKPIRVVVPTGPGSPPDVISRVVATELSDSEGWTVIVENRSGALRIEGTPWMGQSLGQA